MGYVLFGDGKEGGIKVLHGVAGFYNFRKKVQGTIYVAITGDGEPVVRAITGTEERELKKGDRYREGSLEEIFCAREKVDV